ncbi:MAG: hypothetical protein KatS3mg010_0808 [Acidimicrobiia bacterium]|nr:MAG: hypothetical protein KatS3mg010_0808 [Acidimicrobiia bacterium]
MVPGVPTSTIEPRRVPTAGRSTRAVHRLVAAGTCAPASRAGRRRSSSCSARIRPCRRRSSCSSARCTRTTGRASRCSTLVPSRRACRTRSPSASAAPTACATCATSRVRSRSARATGSWSGTLVDATAQIRAQESLRESQSLLAPVAGRRAHRQLPARPPHPRRRVVGRDVPDLRPRAGVVRAVARHGARAHAARGPGDGGRRVRGRRRDRRAVLGALPASAARTVRSGTSTSGPRCCARAPRRWWSTEPSTT